MTENDGLPEPKAFQQYLAKHQDALEWSAKMLAEKILSATGKPFPASYLSLWKTGLRPISREAVNRIATTICYGYASKSVTSLDEEIRVASRGWSSFDWLLSRFLVAAGFATGELRLSEPENRRWEELRSENPPTLRIGWPPVPFWSTTTEGTGPDGASIEAARIVCGLLGLKPDPVRLEWENIETAILDRTVDVIAPLVMNIPSRLWNLRLSREVFKGFGATLAIMTPVSDYQDDKVPTSLPEEFRLGAVRGEAGAFAHYLLPGDRYPEYLQNLAEATDWLLKPNAPNGNGVEGKGAAIRPRPRLVITEKKTAENLIAGHGEVLALVPATSLEGIKFTVSFAGHPHEPLLMEAISKCCEVAEARLSALPAHYERRISSVSH